MGMSSVVYATLRCLRCGDAYRTHVQFRTGDDWGPFCEEGEPATHHEPGCYEGTADGYCPACMRGWVLDEKSSHLGALAAGVASGKLVVKRGELRRDPSSSPVLGADGDYVVELFEDRALPPAEILAEKDSREIPGLWPNAGARFSELRYVIFEHGERVFPERPGQSSGWWSRHNGAAERALRAKAWPSALERTIDVDVEVTDDRAVHVRRGTTAPYEREPRWTRGVSPVDGVAISYLRTGGDKAPLVLLHGLMGSGACWSPVARALEGEFDVIMPDARGHGASGAPAQGYRYDELQAEVVGLIGRLGLARLVIVGHSMGGMTAAVMASYLHGLVRAVILVDPTFLTPERQREVEASDVAEQHRLALQMTKEQLVARAQKRSPHRPLELHEHLAEARLRTHLAAFEVLRPPYPDHLELVRKIRAPALLVLGDDEPVVTRELAEELQRVGVGSGLRVVQLADAGHGLPYDQPARLAEEIAAFVRQLP